MTKIDITIIALYLLVTLVLGIFFSRRGTRSIQEFLVTGRRLPWWLAGMTMIASAFAIDTPIGITGMVARHGIPGVWYAWSFVLGGAGMLGAFVFSAMLRRSEIISPAEIVALRYDGSAATALRAFKAVYFGIIANAVTLGWIIKAVWTIAGVAVPDVNRDLLLAVILTFTLSYTAASGLWGIAATDFIQFIIGSIGSITLAWFAWEHIGGIDHLVDGLTQRYGAAETAMRLRFVPSVASPFFVTFLVFLTLKWWGNPPPAVLQRIIASRNEHHAAKATFFFALVAFGFNYWPMIFVALVSLVTYPDLVGAEAGYAMLIVDILPAGVLGMMLASLIAAFMSTVDTHINYGASYMVNDLYRRFIVRNASGKHYVRAAQVSTVLMLGIAVLFAYSMDSVSRAWYFMSMLTAGYGIVMVARWFWWRVNAKAEIAALAVSGTGSTLLSPRFARWAGYWEAIGEPGWATRFLVTVSVCTAMWVTVTLLTRPASEKTLERFCRKVKPFAVGWGPVVRAHPDIEWNRRFGRVCLQWAGGTAALFCFCFGIGHLMFLRFTIAAILLACAIGLIALVFIPYYTRQAGVKTNAAATDVSVDSD